MNNPILRRIGAIGDVHGDAAALKSALQWFGSQNLDAILCNGDIVDGEGDADKCCDLLRQNSIPTVQGNHDRWLLRGGARDLPHAARADEISALNLSWLQSLPSTLRFQTTCGALLLCHGLGKNDMACVKNEDYGYALEANFELQKLMAGRKFSLVLNGHTHETMAKNFGALTILNPGALGRAWGGWSAIFDFQEGLAHWNQIADGEICSRATGRF